MSLSRGVVQPGQRVLVTLTGWRSRQVTISVCGNLARQGSGDCNLIASQAVAVSPSADTTTEFTVLAPPRTCPCVIRASSVAQDEVVVAPIEILGVPIGPVVGPEYSSPIEVSITPLATVRGLVAALRSTLGGPTEYRVRVRVRNVSSEVISTVALTGSVGRHATDTAASFDPPPPGTIAPGATWEHELRVSLPAPVLGRATWHLVASGAGAPVETTAVTHHPSIGLLLLGAILACDILGMAWYLTVRALAARRAAAHAPEEGPRLPAPAVETAAWSECDVAGNSRQAEDERRDNTAPNGLHGRMPAVVSHRVPHNSR